MIFFLVFFVPDLNCGDPQWSTGDTEQHHFSSVSEHLLGNCFATNVFRAEPSLIPRTDLSMYTEELQPSWSLGRAGRSRDVPLGRGLFDQEGQVIKYWRVHENEGDTFIIIWKKAAMIIVSSVHFMTESKCTASIYHLQRNRGQCEVRGCDLSQDSLREQHELSHTSSSWSHFIFQLLNPCCV